jgi:hypothetical protein
MNPRRRGGRFGEKLLTLTVPHLATDTVERRIQRILGAWQFFRRSLRKWMRERNLLSVEWLRVFEWTPADDGRGHPHLHLWIFSPYLDRALLLDWWEAALQHEGCILDARPIIDIRAVDDAESVASELIKYLTKDIDANGQKIEPDLYAKVYCALDGHRALQASRGLMQRAEREPRACECGATLPRLVRKKKPQEDKGGNIP